MNLRLLFQHIAERSAEMGEEGLISPLFKAEYGVIQNQAVLLTINMSCYYFKYVHVNRYKYV